MSWATGLMVYLVIWWTILFAVLPLGVKRVENPGRGQDHGAPERPQLLRKADHHLARRGRALDRASTSCTRRTFSASATSLK